MSQVHESNMASIEAYTTSFREGLNAAAKAGLSALEETIGEHGYSWLEIYMEGIKNQSSTSNIAQLMKTPSRTQTVKKTRAVTTAMKERTEKVKGLIARLNGSPTRSPMRQPFSPLQPRAVNMLSPSPITAPPMKGSPLKQSASMPKKPELEAKEGRSKSKRTKVQSIEEVSVFEVHEPRDGPMAPVAEHIKPVTVIASTSSAVHQPSAPAHLAVSMPTVAPPVSKPSAPVEDPVVVQEEGDHLEEHIDEEHPRDGAATVELQSHVDRPEEQREVVAAEAATHPPSPKSHVESVMGTAKAVVQKDETILTDVGRPDVAEAPATAIEPISATAARTETVVSQSPASIPIARSAATPASAANPLPAQSQPVRQVRSSWLSKALGNGANPSTASGTRPSEALNLRKSFAPSNQDIPADFATARKSIVPSGTLGQKRPSETGLEEDKRPEKIFRPNIVRIDSLPKPAPLSHTPGPAQAAAPEPTSSAGRDPQRSDIHKVAKALEDMREKAAAKEAARQKAALVSSVGPKQSEPVAATSGFLKGLGSLGMGLGRSLGLGAASRQAEEEALRSREEEERAEREAEEEFERRFGAASHEKEVSFEEKTPAIESQPDGVMVSQTLVATQPFAELESTETHAPMDVENEQEVAEEIDELMDDDEEDVPITQTYRSPTPPRRSLNRQATPPPMPQVIAQVQAVSTTPMASPPKQSGTLAPIAQLSQPVFKSHASSALLQLAHAAQLTFEVPVRAPLSQVEKAEAPAQHTRFPSSPAPPQVSDDNEDDELPELPEPEMEQDKTDTEEEEDDDEILQEMPAKKMFKSDTEAGSKAPRPKLGSTTSAGSLVASTSSQASMFGHASTIASKTLGFKPTTGNVKSIQLAAAAAKKQEQAALEKKAHMREQTEARKAEAQRKKAEEDKVKAEEDKRARAAELEEKRRIRLEAERRRREREEKIAMAAREKAAKEEAERVAAKLKAEEEARKRKAAAAAAMQKAQQGTLKRMAATPAPPSAPALAPVIKPAMAPIRPIMKPTTTPLAAPAPKLGPTGFRTEPIPPYVQPGQIPRTLGPPSRPSQHPSTQQARASGVLQQNRAALQQQMEEVQSEDIELPDINSEYSDSDDSDKEDDWKRPQWAESPDLRKALAEQASRDPDELFGPIKPLNMEELFKVKTNKFRSRTSSANWGGGDRLTKVEEKEYARRMGFKPMPGAAGA